MLFFILHLTEPCLLSSMLSKRLQKIRLLQEGKIPDRWWTRGLKGCTSFAQSTRMIFRYPLGITTGLFLFIWFVNALTYYCEVLLTTTVSLLRLLINLFIRPSVLGEIWRHLQWRNLLYCMLFGLAQIPVQINSFFSSKAIIGNFELQRQRAAPVGGQTWPNNAVDLKVCMHCIFLLPWVQPKDPALKTISSQESDTFPIQSLCETCRKHLCFQGWLLVPLQAWRSSTRMKGKDAFL